MDVKPMDVDPIPYYQLPPPILADPEQKTEVIAADAVNIWMSEKVDEV